MPSARPQPAPVTHVAAPGRERRERLGRTPVGGDRDDDALVVGLAQRVEGGGHPLLLLRVEGQRRLHRERPAGAARHDVGDQPVLQRPPLEDQERNGLGQRLTGDLLDQGRARVGPAEGQERGEDVDPLLAGVAGRLEQAGNRHRRKLLYAVWAAGKSSGPSRRAQPARAISPTRGKRPPRAAGRYRPGRPPWKRKANPCSACMRAAAALPRGQAS